MGRAQHIQAPEIREKMAAAWGRDELSNPHLLEGLGHLRTPTLVHLIEREVKYVVSTKALRKLDLGSLPRAVIRQYYFPSEMLGRVGKLAFELKGVSWPKREFQFCQVRLRETIQGDERSYHLQAKGRIEGKRRWERVEISVPLPLDVFRDLRRYATAGFLEKARYEIGGCVRRPSRHLVLVHAHLDVLRRAGRDRERSGEVNFVTVDVELPERALVKAFRQGEHSFRFLDKAVELTAESRSVRKALSTKRLARCGLDRKALRTVRDLLFD